MLPPSPLQEISIKVPAPFAGVDDLGFTAQYRAQSLFEPLRDVPLLIEGPAPAVRRLAERLAPLRTRTGSPYAWTDAVLLTEEVAVIAFRDRSLETAGPARSSLDYVLNLVRPVVFPFLQDCALVAQLRLSERIEVRIQDARRRIADLELRIDQIVSPNGTLLLT